MKERVQKLLAQANIASRRAAEELIEQRRVKVNGKVVQLGEKADPEKDVIEVDGTRIKFDEGKKLYIALNKPKQVLSTNSPHRGDERDTLYDLVPVRERLFPIGRLDADSEGLVVLTNDGAMAQRLTHPRYRHTKTYRVVVQGLPTAETLERWQGSITLEDGNTSPCLVKITKGDERESVLRIVMTEGKKRQIRRVANLLGHPVRRLTRTHIGMLSVEDLKPGEWRELTPREIEALKTPSPELREIRGRHARLRDARQGDDNAAPRPRRPRSDNEGDAPRSRRLHAGDEGDTPRRRSYRGRASDRDDSGNTPRRPRATERRFQGDDNTAPRPRRPRSDDEGDAPRQGSYRGAQGRGASDRDDSGDMPRRPRATERRFQGDDNAVPRPRRPRSDNDGDASRRSSYRRDARGDDEGETPRRPHAADRRFQRDDDTARPRRPRTSERRFQGDDDTAPRPRHPRSDDEGGAPRRSSYRRDARGDDEGDTPRRPRAADRRFQRDDDTAPRPRRPRSDDEGSAPRRRTPRRDEDSGRDAPRSDARRPRRRSEDDEATSADTPRRPRRPAGNRTGGDSPRSESPRRRSSPSAPRDNSPRRRNPRKRDQ
jgi:23S rRNA pseudouridine2605 synthase